MVIRGQYLIKFMFVHICHLKQNVILGDPSAVRIIEDIVVTYWGESTRIANSVIWHLFYDDEIPRAQSVLWEVKAKGVYGEKFKKIIDNTN